MARIEPLSLELIGAGVADEHEVRLVDMMVRPEDLEETLAEWTPDVAGATSEIVHVETWHCVFHGDGTHSSIVFSIIGEDLRENRI